MAEEETNGALRELKQKQKQFDYSTEWMRDQPGKVHRNQTKMRIFAILTWIKNYVTYITYSL